MTELSRAPSIKPGWLLAFPTTVSVFHCLGFLSSNILLPLFVCLFPVLPIFILFILKSSFWFSWTEEAAKVAVGI